MATQLELIEVKTLYNRSSPLTVFIDFEKDLIGNVWDKVACKERKRMEDFRLISKNICLTSADKVLKPINHFITKNDTLSMILNMGGPAAASVLLETVNIWYTKKFDLDKHKVFINTLDDECPICSEYKCRISLKCGHSVCKCCSQPLLNCPFCRISLNTVVTPSAPPIDRYIVTPSAPSN